MTCSISLLRAGEVRPQPERPLSTTPASGRPPQLDDRDWLARRYALDGDNAIATELGVSRGTVIRARKRLGIRSAATGPRRGSQTVAARSLHPAAAELIRARLAEESCPDGPAPSLALVAGRVRALHDANTHGERSDVIEALVSLASACGLAVDHLHRLEAA